MELMLFRLILHLCFLWLLLADLMKTLDDLVDKPVWS